MEIAFYAGAGITVAWVLLSLVAALLGASLL